MRANKATIDAIRAALIGGERSAEPQSFDGNKFKLKMTAKYGE